MNEQIPQLETTLELVEANLRTKLLAALPSAAQTGADYFTNSNFNPHSILLEHLRPETEKFVSAANECIRIREKLGLSITGTVGHLYLACCAELAELKNEHRRGPRKLSAWLMGQLGAGNAI